jgi:methylase of polypeptide subunit release factors
LTQTGLGPKKHQRWHVPASLLEEVLSAAREEAKDEPRRRYVIDLCAGRGSWLEVVQQQGLHYVPVDIDISAFAQWVSAIN